MLSAGIYGNTAHLKAKYAAGYYSRKSRQHILSARLRTKRISHARSFYDVRMSFHRSLGQQLQKLDNIARPRNRKLLEQRHSEALVRVSDGCGEAISDRVVAHCRDGPSAKLFLEPYNPQLELSWTSRQMIWVSFIMRVKPYMRRVKSSMVHSSEIWRVVERG